MSDHPASDSKANILQRLGEIITDIKTLLDYLSRLDHGLLQAHFDDTRSAGSQTVQLRAVPPCHTYADFLTRLAWLGTSISKDQWPPDPMPQSSATLRTPAGQAGATAIQPPVDAPLDDIPFLIWSRDFLASVASPATVETIEITRAYVEARARHRIWRWLKRRLKVPTAAGYGGGRHASPPHTGAARKSDSERAGRTLHGGRLATSVSIVEVLALVATFVALIASTYVLSGQSILTLNQTEAANYATVKQQIEAVAEGLPLSDRRIAVDPISLCQQTMAPASTIFAAMGTMVPAATEKSASEVTQPNDQTGRNVRLGYYCQQEGAAQVMLQATRTSLQTWVRVITSPRDLQISSYSIPLTRLASLFGDAGELVLNDGAPSGSQGATSSAALLERSGAIAQSILSAVSLYLMPCLYGLIGAAAATLRMLRRKVDAATLGYTDRGGVKQNLILGVMCGATIGLFAGYILGANSTQGLGLSALALLAGYNVSGVFAFLDELSARLFRPTDAVTGKG